MAKAVVNEETLTSIADAIRIVSGSEDTLLPSEMHDAILSGAASPIRILEPVGDYQGYIYCMVGTAGSTGLIETYADGANVRTRSYALEVGKTYAVVMGTPATTRFRAVATSTALETMVGSDGVIAEGNIGSGLILEFTSTPAAGTGRAFCNTAYAWLSVYYTNAGEQCSVAVYEIDPSAVARIKEEQQ